MQPLAKANNLRCTCCGFTVMFSGNPARRGQSITSSYSGHSLGSLQCCRGLPESQHRLPCLENERMQESNLCPHPRKRTIENPRIHTIPEMAETMPDSKTLQTVRCRQTSTATSARLRGREVVKFFLGVSVEFWHPSCTVAGDCSTLD